MPAKLRDIVRALEAMGGTVEPSKGGSSHWKATRNGTVYPLAAHNGLKSEISDLYIKGLCRCFGLDEREFRALM